MMDFESTGKDAIRSARSAIADIYEFSVYHAMKDTSFGKTDIRKNDFFAISGKTLLGVEDTLERATLKAAEAALKKKSCTALTVFYSEGMAEEFVNSMVSKLEDIADAEVVAVMAGEISASFTIMIS
jgi:dihydroxyacetone kinase-like predicted kinase